MIHMLDGTGDSMERWNPRGGGSHHGASHGGSTVVQRFDFASGQDVRIPIGLSAEAWFQLARDLGSVTVAAHNAFGALGWAGTFPPLELQSLVVLPQCRSAHYSPNLAEYVHLYVFRRSDAKGCQYGLEVSDGLGRAFHRIVAQSDEAVEVLHQTLAIHRRVAIQQRSETLPSPWFPLNHAASIERQRAIAGRIPLLRRKHAAHCAGVKRLRISGLETLLRAAADAGQPLRATFFHRGLICGIGWVPEVLFATPAGTVRVFGGSAGLEFDPRRIRSAWLWKEACSCCSRQRWAIEIGDAEDHLGLALMAAEKDDESTWRRFLGKGLRL